MLPVTLLLASCEGCDQSTPSVRFEAQRPPARAVDDTATQSGSITLYARAPAVAISGRPSPSKSATVGGPPVPPPGSAMGPNTVRPSSVSTRTYPDDTTASSGSAASRTAALVQSPRFATATCPSPQPAPGQLARA